MAGRPRHSRLASYVLRQRGPLAAIGGFTLFTSALTALQPWPVKLLVDHGLKGEPLPGALPWSTSPWMLVMAAAAATLAVFCLNAAVDAGLNWSWTVAGQRMVHELSTDLFHKLQRLSPLFHSRGAVGDHLSRLSTDSWCVYSLTAGLFAPGQHALTIVTVGVVAWRLDAQLAGLSFLLAPLLAGSSIYFGRRMKNRARQGREAQARLVSFVQQTLSSIPVVQAFSTEQRNWRRFQSLASDAVALSQRGALVSSTYGLVNGLIVTLGTAVVLYAGSRRVMAGALSLGSLLVFLQYLRNLQTACDGLLKTYAALKPVEASIDRVLEILDEPEAVTDAPDARPIRSAGGAVRIGFEDVTFGYEPGRPVLRDVSLEIRPGETLALVGPTGAGKSTLVSLVPRFFDPWTGRVTFDGADLRRLRVADVRAQVAMVLQEAYLFPATVAENIRYGREGATREQIVEAARAANADEFIRRLPEGYDTVLGQHGAGISGGEKQRIAIARAFLRDAPVLILDEPSAALDARTETLLLDALERLMAGRTTLIVAHRLSTVRRADRVAVMNAGKIVECGPAEELLARGGVYARLHALQLEGLPRRAAS